MFEGAGDDPAHLDVPLEVLLLEADDPAELVGGQIPLVDEPVEAPQGDTEA